MRAIPLWRVQPERGSRLLMRLIVAIGLKIGRRAGRALLYPICAYFLLFSGPARRASRDYLGRVFSRRPRWRDVFRHYHCFAGQIYDRIHVLAHDLKSSDCLVEGEEILDDAIAQGRGVLLFGAHFGSFEVMRVAATAKASARLRVLMHLDNAEKMARVLGPLNAPMSRQIIGLGRPQTMLEVRDALAQGDMVGLLADRVVKGDRVRRCQFLGEPAPFPEGPFVLAAALRVPVVLFSAAQIDGRSYRIRFEAFAAKVDLGESRDAALQQMCERYAGWLEARCREAPFNWFNFYDFWDVAPSAARS